MNASSTSAWTLTCHSNYGAEDGRVTAIRATATGFDVHTIPAAPKSGLSIERRPVFLGLRADLQALLLDPVTKKIASAAQVPVDVVPTYAYPEHANTRLWFSNDGDEETGNDTLNCGMTGSSVTIIENKKDGAVLKTLCIGRGHHVTAFSGPSADRPAIPQRAFVSNLQDGTISVLGNDPARTSEYLSVIHTINLVEPDKEKTPGISVPNNAFPHGMVFSAVSGRIYNLNNGYGTVVVIDPINNAIEARIPLPGCSNLLLSPNGRYVIGKGADRKSNPDHVIGKIAVIDVTTHTVAAELNVPDFYPSTFRFSPDGQKLYVTSAATGKGKQKDHLKLRTVLVFDARALPDLKLLREIPVGAADCSRRPLAFVSDGGRPRYVFVPNPTDGTLSVLDAGSDGLVETLTIGPPGCEEVLFSFWDSAIGGC